MIQHRSIVILGGSYGGVSISHHVLKHTIPALPDSDTYQVVLVSTSSQAMCRQACPRAMLSDSLFDQSKLFVDIEGQFMQYDQHFKFIHGKATNMSTSERRVTVSCYDGTPLELPYYALIIATGASATSPLHGLQGDASDLKATWTNFRTALLEARNIVVAGGGPTGVETAGELGQYLNGWNKPSKVGISLITSGRVLPLLRPELASQAEVYLAQVGVSLVQDAKVQSTVPESAGIIERDLTTPTTVTLSSGQVVSADIFIPAYGTRPNTAFAPKTLLAEDGRIKTNMNLRVEEAGPRVYAIGKWWI